MSDIALPDPPFAAETEETIRARMLAAVDPAFNTDPGDIVYDMLTPAAIEMDRIYDAMEIFMGEAFVSVASGTYLDALGVQLVGIVRITDETDTVYRARLLARLEAPVGAGNVADYKQWAFETGIVGYATVEPVYGGTAGAVRVLIATAARAASSGGDQTTVATYIGTKKPFDATVTVASITTTTVTIVTTVTVLPGYVKDAALKAKVTEEILAYINTLGPGDDVLYNEIIHAILEVDGISDVTALTINAVGATLAIGATNLSVFPANGSTLTVN